MFCFGNRPESRRHGNKPSPFVLASDIGKIKFHSRAIQGGVTTPIRVDSTGWVGPYAMPRSVS
jgi:hypothetical protein